MYLPLSGNVENLHPVAVAHKQQEEIPWIWDHGMHYPTLTLRLTHRQDPTKTPAAPLPLRSPRRRASLHFTPSHRAEKCCCPQHFLVSFQHIHSLNYLTGNPTRHTVYWKEGVHSISVMSSLEAEQKGIIHINTCIIFDLRERKCEENVFW
jgi:hypothetical protein